MTIEQVREKLNSKKSADRLSAAKRIGKDKIMALAEDLFAAYTREKADKRTWEPQSEMIKALGILDYKPAFDDINTIVRANIPHDMITISAATAFVQLKRNSLQDAQPVLELLAFGSTSVICGALEALYLDRMLPPTHEIEQIISACWDINKHKDRIGHEFGLIDPRVYLAAACAGWDQSLTHDFLQHCIATAFNINRFGQPVENVQLVNVCKKSLEGKFSIL